ncbi:MAG: penicillin-binding protein 2, partial [Elusimicrobia bacterium]|nr:penicillin-binding protein 2 [Elusimicrobiota bacterium]
KIVAAAAALDQGVIDEKQTIFCENGTWSIAPGTTIHDHEPEGALTLAGILQHSSNIGAAKLGERLGPERFYRYARAFGFGGKTGVDLPGETAGELRGLPQLTRVALGASSYGYGVAVSALQMVDAYSAIANGGLLYAPKLIEDGEPPARLRRVASADTMRRLSLMLEGVVDKGTGQSAGIPGYRIAGKTGTARRIDPKTHRYSTHQYNASFVGFLPASRPRWTILVVLENPRGAYYGAEVAAPVFARIARQLLVLDGIAPDKPQTVAAAP